LAAGRQVLWNAKVVLIVLHFCWKNNTTGSVFVLSTCVLFSFYFVYLENTVVCKLLVEYFLWNENHLDNLTEFYQSFCNRLFSWHLVRRR